MKPGMIFFIVAEDDLCCYCHEKVSPSVLVECSQCHIRICHINGCDSPPSRFLNDEWICPKCERRSGK